VANQAALIFTNFLVWLSNYDGSNFQSISRVSSFKTYTYIDTYLSFCFAGQTLICACNTELTFLSRAIKRVPIVSAVPGSV
jgi:hypothetical protein